MINISFPGMTIHRGEKKQKNIKIFRDLITKYDPATISI